MAGQAEQQVDQEDDGDHRDDDAGDLVERLRQPDVADQPPQQVADQASERPA
jgi:hypothetical protein